MKSFWKMTLGVLGCWLLLICPAEAKLKVCASLPDFASVAREVGGTHVEVMSLTDGTQDPHFVPAKPSLMRAVRSADVYIAAGLELEVGWLPVILQGSRNPKIQPGATGFVDASQGVQVMDQAVGTVSRAEGDVHPLGNPHYYADPMNLKPLASRLAVKFGELDAANAEDYRKNADVFAKRLERSMAAWMKRLAPSKGRAVVAYHDNYLYLTKRFGLVDFGFLENKPGIPPSARHLSELSSKMKAAKVKVVLYQPYYDAEACRRLAASARAKALLLPTEAGGVPGVTDMFSRMDVVVSTLEKAFRD
jgi:zinc/manganese transport system substrate-binding protein